MTFIQSQLILTKHYIQLYSLLEVCLHFGPKFFTMTRGINLLRPGGNLGQGGGAIVPPEFGSSVNPQSQSGGVRLCPPHCYSPPPPEFSELPTALLLGNTQNPLGRTRCMMDKMSKSKEEALQRPGPQCVH